MSGAIMNKVWDLFGVDPSADTEDENDNEYEIDEYETENEEVEGKKFFGRKTQQHQSSKYATNATNKNGNISTNII